MKKISHDIKEESIEAKVRWFRALPMSEMMEIFCNYNDLALEINPDLAAGRDVDLEDVRLLQLPMAGRVRPQSQMGAGEEPDTVIF